MEYEKIKQLMEDMGNSKLSEINIDFPDGTKISMKKEEKNIVKTIEKQVVADDTKVVIENEEVQEKHQEEGNIIKSPMVGTFYLKPSPNAKPFVEVGQNISKGDTVCIIEAMKLMNEIESEFDGIIKEILVKDGEIVEYGKPLFRIV